MSAKPSRIQLKASLLSIVMLAACTGEQGELQEWMEQQKREVKPSVQPLSPPSGD